MPNYSNIVFNSKLLDTLDPFEHPNSYQPQLAKFVNAMEDASGDLSTIQETVRNTTIDPKKLRASTKDVEGFVGGGWKEDLKVAADVKVLIEQSYDYILEGRLEIAEPQLSLAKWSKHTGFRERGISDFIAEKGSILNITNSGAVYLDKQFKDKLKVEDFNITKDKKGKFADPKNDEVMNTRIYLSDLGFFDGFYFVKTVTHSITKAGVYTAMTAVARKADTDTAATAGYSKKSKTQKQKTLFDMDGKRLNNDGSTQVKDVQVIKNIDDLLRDDFTYTSDKFGLSYDPLFLPLPENLPKPSEYESEYRSPGGQVYH